MSTAPDSPINGETPRTTILQKVTDGIERLSKQIECCNPGTMGEERLQLQRYRELGYLTNQYRKLKRDTDIEQMQEDLELLHRDGSRE